MYLPDEIQIAMHFKSLEKLAGAHFKSFNPFFQQLETNPMYLFFVCPPFLLIV